MIRLGDFELHAVSDGRFRLDGGAMFGIVPKVLWEKVAPADERNRITLGLTSLLIRTGRRNVLVDTGIGAKHDAKFIDYYAVERPTPLPEGLRKLGLSVEDIDIVVLSHLHFDHTGGSTTRRGDEVVPTFPRATYIVQRGMWDEAQVPNLRTRGSYMPEDFLPLEKAGQLKLVDDGYEVVPGVVCRKTGGHVRNHQSVFLESGGRKAIYWADLMPTGGHVKPAWVMGYDLFPAEVAELKERLLKDVIREGWVNIFEHDPKVAMAYVREGYKLEPIELLGGGPSA